MRDCAYSAAIVLQTRGARKSVRDCRFVVGVDAVKGSFWKAQLFRNLPSEQVS